MSFPKKTKIKVLGTSGSARDEFNMVQESSNSEELLKRCLASCEKLGAKTELIPPLNNASQNQSQLDTDQIFIKNFAFSLNELNINKDGTVTWTNDDSVSHDIYRSGFKSPLLSKEQSFSFTFNEEGTFDYIYAIYPSMKGKIVVK
ncbi:MAG: hypothetical protein P1P85_03855 [Patescibacteria group bacterium]|nr:hypothetical protein [Patescibacteria group bacterium]